MSVVGLWWAAVAGAALGFAFAAGSAALFGRRVRGVLAAGLVVAALVYLVFALFGGADGGWLLAELGGVALFSVVAWLGVWRSPWWLALGWVVHGSWDLLLHVPPGHAGVPAWYPPACFAFDLAVGAWIAWEIVRRRAER